MIVRYLDFCLIIIRRKIGYLQNLNYEGNAYCIYTITHTNLSISQNKFQLIFKTKQTSCHLQTIHRLTKCNYKADVMSTAFHV